MEQYRKKGLINLVSFLFHSYSLGAKHHEHEDIRLGGASDIADDPLSTSSAKDSIDPPSSIQQQPTANNVLPKDYQNEERKKSNNLSWIKPTALWDCSTTCKIIQMGVVTRRVQKWLSLNRHLK